MFARKEFPKFVVSTIKPQKESKGQIMFDHNDDLSNSVVFLADVKTDDEIQFTASRLKGLPEFINALYAWANSKGAKNVLFYIHGFNVQPQNAFSQWRKLKRQFGVANGPRTIVVPIIWPALNESIFGGRAWNVWFDRARSKKAGILLASLVNNIRSFMQNRGRGDMTYHIMCHSMGSWLMLNCAKALADAREKAEKRNLPEPTVAFKFKTLHMVAANAPASMFSSDYKHSPGKMLSLLAETIHVTYCKDDLALRVYPGDDLGQNGPSFITPSITNVKTLDIYNIAPVHSVEDIDSNNHGYHSLIYFVQYMADTFTSRPRIFNTSASAGTASHATVTTRRTSGSMSKNPEQIFLRSSL